VVVIVGIAVAPAGAQSATVKFPRLDQWMEHSDPEAMSTLGWVFEVDDLDDPLLGTTADFLLMSMFKDVDGQPEVGMGFVHRGPELTPPVAAAFIKPHVIEQDEHFGQLKVTVADFRGLAADPGDAANLALIPSIFRTADLSECAGGVPNATVGAVDVFDLSNPLSPSWQFTIDPPPLPGDTLPCGVARFGHWSDFGDIDGDGWNDLVVGAPIADGSQGRVYLFFGHADFTEPVLPPENKPGWLYRWAVLRPPPDPATGPVFASGGQLGFSLSVADLDGDGRAEVGVARLERSAGPGRVHVFHGAWIHELVGHHPFTEIVPPAPPHINAGVPGVYETLIDNDAAFRPSDPNAGFGWVVSLKAGDLGQPLVQGLDEKPDVLVHSEAAASLDAAGSRNVDAGALFVYWNDSTGPLSLSLVNEGEPVKLMTPRIPATGGQPAYGPQTLARFGRAFAVADWQHLDGSPVRILLVGEPDRSYLDPANPGQWVRYAGAVFAFELPLPPDFDPHSLTDPHINAWGNQALLEPDGSLPQNVQAILAAPGAMTPTGGGEFGGWIEEGVYDTFFPGHQLGICARNRDVNGVVGVGRVYALTLPTTEP
jgi:hypothetical protein